MILLKVYVLVDEHQTKHQAMKHVQSFNASLQVSRNEAMLELMLVTTRICGGRRKLPQRWHANNTDEGTQKK